MKTIQERIALFLNLAGVSANRLAVEAGVPRATLSKVLSGLQPDVRHRTACSLFEAMKRLDHDAARKALR